MSSCRSKRSKVNENELVLLLDTLKMVLWNQSMIFIWLLMN